MSASSRELVLQTLNFEGPGRVPRHWWTLPIAEKNHPSECAALRRDFPPDTIWLDGHCREKSSTRGDAYQVGESVDAWGCVFVNIQEGVHGEVKEPMVRDWKRDLARVHVPREWLTIDRDAINRDCAATDKFTLSGCCPRPFEQLQFIRGTEDLYCDLMESSRELRAFIREMHQFYCELLSAWARTDCDCLCFMDDWGSQRTLLISPELWRSVFKPMYRDYGQIARSAGKKLHMHSDGHILSILEDLIEVGVDAINSQLFSMGIEAVKPFAGRITFWGEIDRQRMLPSATRAEIDQAVRAVYANLWRNGGCVGQCEFGPGAKPENVRQVFESWNKVMR